MPNLQILNCQHNRIMIESVANLDYGNRLQVLDLSENRLGWSPRKFLEDLNSHFRCCVQLRRLCLDGNPFAKELQNYQHFVIQCFFSSSDGGGGGGGGDGSNSDSDLDQEYALFTKQEEDEARNLRQGYHSSGRAVRRLERSKKRRDKSHERRKRLTERCARSSLNFVDNIQVSDQLIFECRNLMLTEDQLCANSFRLGVQDGYSEQSREEDAGIGDSTSSSSGGGGKSKMSVEQKASQAARSQLWSVTQDDYNREYFRFNDRMMPKMVDIQHALRSCLATPLSARKQLRSIFTWIHLMLDIGEEEHVQLVQRLGTYNFAIMI